MSSVKIVEAELKMEVKEDIKAASITANISPLNTENKRLRELSGKCSDSHSPTGDSLSTRNTKETLEQPVSDPQISIHFSGLEQAT